MDYLGIEGSPELIPVISAQLGCNLVFMKISQVFDKMSLISLNYRGVPAVCSAIVTP